MQTEKRLYVDGLWLARHAAERLDASFNWVDVAALARRAGGGAPINACYFAIFDPQDPQSASPARALIQALESQGVTCVVREEPAPPQECTRCGHGWEHYPETLLGVDLALAVAGDAASGAVDEAVDWLAPRIDPRPPVLRLVPVEGFEILGEAHLRGDGHAHGPAASAIAMPASVSRVSTACCASTSARAAEVGLAGKGHGRVIEHKVNGCSPGM